MRLRLVASTLAASLVIGWAASAAAQPGPPLSPPIFYCPGPGARAVAAPEAAPVARAAHWRRATACPGRREVAVARRHHQRYARAARMGPPEVSESQAFIYRYERAMHGLNARAAEEAWGRAPPPPLPAPPPMAMVAPMGPPPMARPMGPHCPPQAERCPWARPAPWPPQVGSGRPGRALFAAGDRRWRDGSYGAVYRVAGRDAFGYLVWPGKTAPGDITP